MKRFAGRGFSREMDIDPKGRTHAQDHPQLVVEFAMIGGAARQDADKLWVT
ncbi:MAG TPA: hypothetical protein VMM16_11760 [Verrucomicrobiae bacterium]|nr:hypothetical protein [Verrucomicrobiae bacterium]